VVVVEDGQTELEMFLALLFLILLGVGQDKEVLEELLLAWVYLLAAAVAEVAEMVVPEAVYLLVEHQELLGRVEILWRAVPLDLPHILQILTLVLDLVVHNQYMVKQETEELEQQLLVALAVPVELVV
jgi:hypothetical protein